ncbi:hypothetical protein E4U58_002732 [Claviceps cyperi]|nr:hypothetical protein E4U58_002732 [Claviceps cyperi]
MRGHRLPEGKAATATTDNNDNSSSNNSNDDDDDDDDVETSISIFTNSSPVCIGVHFKPNQYRRPRLLATDVSC